MVSLTKAKTQTSSPRCYLHKAAKKSAYGSAIAGDSKKSRAPMEGKNDIVSENESIEEIVRDFSPPRRFHHPSAFESYQSDAAKPHGVGHFSEDEGSETESGGEDESKSDGSSDTLEPAIKEEFNVKPGDSDQVERLAAETRSSSAGRIRLQYDVPAWFPKRIKQMFLADRHGGQFRFKELDRITRYRTALERSKRRKWRTYLKAGRARWQLQRTLRRMRRRPLTKTFHQYRKSQYKTWKRRSIRSWERLEKLHLGIRVLDEAIDTNFRQERIIYAKYLG